VRSTAPSGTPTSISRALAEGSVGDGVGGDGAAFGGDHPVVDLDEQRAGEAPAQVLPPWGWVFGMIWVSQQGEWTGGHDMTTMSESRAGAGTGADLTDLDTRGFVLIREFLSPDEVAVLRTDFASSPADPNGNYTLRSPSPEAAKIVRARMEPMVALVRSGTTIGADTITGGSYFFTGVADGIDLPWHQDHESYFHTQNHHDYLNFYLPVVKPDPARSNLSLIPYDRLRAERPETYEVVVGGGARRFTMIGTRLLAFDDERCTVHHVVGGLDELAETPHLQPGDLLLLRGDIIHKTQDASTERAALSMRVACSTTVLTRERLTGGGLVKAVMTAHNREPMRRYLRAMDDAGVDELTYGELQARAAVMDLGPYGRRAFVVQLLSEKWRARQLSRLTVDSARTVGYDVLRRAHEVRATRHRRAERGA
jgi:hypothetical protein